MTCEEWFNRCVWWADRLVINDILNPLTRERNITLSGPAGNVAFLVSDKKLMQAERWEGPLVDRIVQADEDYYDLVWENAKSLGPLLTG